MIPASIKSVYLQSSASNVGFELGVATGISFQTRDSRAANIDIGGVIYGPFRCVNSQYPTVVSIYNTTGGTVNVRVYAGPTS